MWRRPVSRIMILYMDNFLLSCSFATKYFLCMVVKKNIFFLEENTISLIESHVSKIFIPNDFQRSGDEGLQTGYYECSGFLTSMKEQY